MLFVNEYMLEIRIDAHVFDIVCDVQSEKGSDEEEDHLVGFGKHGGICAICLDKIVLQETALVKGCEHAYWFVQTNYLLLLFLELSL